MTSAQRPRENDHIAALDGLRGLACFAVVLSHEQNHRFFVKFAPQLGSVGVLLFFGLSGFLMAYLYAEERFERSNVVNYAINRFSRIAPIYLLVVIACYIIRTQFDANFIFDVNDHNILRHLFFSGSAGVFWSIPPEVQFYGFFLLFWAAIAGYRLSSWSALISLVLIVGIFLAAGHGSPGIFLASKIQIFLAGAVSGLLRRKISSNAPSGSYLVLAQCSTLTVIFLAAFWPDWNPLSIPRTGNFGDPLYLDLRLSLLSAAVIFFYSYETIWTRWTVGSAVLRKIGAWSFSMYLIHDPILYWYKSIAPGSGEYLPLHAIVATAAIIFFSWLVHKAVERPLQSLTKSGLRKITSPLFPHPPKMQSGISRL